MPNRRRLTALLLATAALLAACGGVPGGGDPASVVTGAMQAVANKDVDALRGFACAAQQDEIAEQFDLTGGLGELAPGVDAEQVLEAITIDTSQVTVGSPSVDGSTATVQLGGSMTIDIDAEALRPIIVAALEAQGMPTDDASVDAMLGMLGGFTGQPIPMTETLELVQEGGAWKICS